MNTNLHPSVQTRNPQVARFLTGADSFMADRAVSLKEYGRVHFRPIRVDDEVRMTRFHGTLSEESIYLRYFEHMSLDTRTLHERLAVVCTNTEDSYALVAERDETSEDPAQILAVGRLTTTGKIDEASFALLCGEKVQATVLPRELLKCLKDIARLHGFRTVTGELLVADHDTIDLCRHQGFALHALLEDGIVQATCTL